MGSTYMNILREIEISFDGGNKRIVELSDACTTWKEIR